MTAIVLASLLAPLPAGDEAASALEGVWVLVALEYEGTPWAPEQVKTLGHELSLRNGRFVATRRGDGPSTGSYQWDATKSPKEYESTKDKGPEAGRTYLDIYEIEGDTLRLCSYKSGTPRPKGFKTTPGSQLWLQTFRRKRP